MVNKKSPPDGAMRSISIDCIIISIVLHFFLNDAIDWNSLGLAFNSCAVLDCYSVFPKHSCRTVLEYSNGATDSRGCRAGVSGFRCHSIFTLGRRQTLIRLRILIFVFSSRDMNRFVHAGTSHGIVMVHRPLSPSSMKWSPQCVSFSVHCTCFDGGGDNDDDENVTVETDGAGHSQAQQEKLRHSCTNE